MDIDLENDGSTPHDYGDTEESTNTDAGPNGLLNSPISVTTYYDSESDKTIISGRIISNDQESLVIDIFGSENGEEAPSSFDAGSDTLSSTGTVNDLDLAPSIALASSQIKSTIPPQPQQDNVSTPSFSSLSGENPLVYLGFATPDSAGYYTKTIGGKLGKKQVTDIYATDKKGEGSASEKGIVCKSPDSKGNNDTDGDGLCDDWETKVFDINKDGTVDFKPLGSNPLIIDIFVEVVL